MVARTGFEPVIQPWEGNIVTYIIALNKVLFINSKAKFIILSQFCHSFNLFDVNYWFKLIIINHCLSLNIKK